MEFEKNKIEWLDYDLLEKYPHITGRTYLRHGGTSTGHFSCLNVSDRVGDHPDCVKVNREIVREDLGVSKLIFLNQVHGTTISWLEKKAVIPSIQADAIVTKDKDIGICITHADCQAAIFYDPINEAIGVVHVGWKGLVQNFYSRVVNFFVREIGTKPEELIVCISPSLGPDHAEFRNYKREIPEEYWGYQVQPRFFNFWEIAKSQLRASDVLPEHVELVETCTCCSARDFYSYRRENETGRHVTVAAIKG